MDVEKLEQVDESPDFDSLDLDLGVICRCCMGSKRRMKHLFTMELDDMLHSVTGIRPRQDDGLPGLLCVPCVLQLRRSHHFKQQSEKTDRVLRGYLKHELFMKSFEPPPGEDLVQKIEEPVDSPAVDTDSNNEPTDRKCDLRIELAQPVACPKCDKEFLNERKMKRHMRIHSSEGYHQCTQCDKAFADKSNLTKHMRKHTGELRNLKIKPHLCAECGKSFKYSTSLSRHKRLHSKRNVFTCEICHKFYAEHQTLVNHMRTHTNERPYSCSICDKQFAQKPNLDRHELTHTGVKPYACDLCDKQFTQKSYLIVHKRIHAAEKPFQCSSCSMAFVSQNSLQKHLRTPCSDRPFACTRCSITFRYKSSLRRHRRSHKDGEYICRICALAFHNASKLTNHMSTRHPNVLWEHDYDATPCIKRKPTQPSNEKPYESDDEFKRLTTKELQHQDEQAEGCLPRDETVFDESYEAEEELALSYDECSYIDQHTVEPVENEPLLSIQIIQTEELSS
ncbi:zinc finger protein [Anopheles darlingi]|uniref:Zinc finger protein n=1 Tax=Anopheles darlingi TaxID=43151 RepID=W5J8G2_ANODA|nr:zinc finger protein 771-like [Anopheles darlingi]ETN59079.1 zinc finger protein [Anopheles darlingi]